MLRSLAEGESFAMKLYLLASALGATACVPSLVLEGVSEERSNAPNSPFTLRASCADLGNSSVAIPPPNPNQSGAFC